VSQQRKAKEGEKQKEEKKKASKIVNDWIHLAGIRINSIRINNNQTASKG
jgi:hypothetical protein